MHKIKEMLPHHHEEKTVEKKSTTTTPHHDKSKEVLKTTSHSPKLSHSPKKTTLHSPKHSPKKSQLHSPKHSPKKSKHLMSEEKYSHVHGHEKHVMHEAGHLKEGEFYKLGSDPSYNREVACTNRHDDGVLREVVADAPVVKTTVKEVELHKVQPIIHRDREQKEIRHVVEPHKEFKVRDTEIHHQDRDINLGTRREDSTLHSKRSAGHAPKLESSREFLGKECQHQDLPVKIDEHVHRKVETHVHPVIYKEVLKPKVTEETHHIYEKVKEVPIETYEVKDIKSRGSGEKLREAEREFFAKESHRGMVLGKDHICDDIKTSSPKHHEKKVEVHKHHEHEHEHLHAHEHQKTVFCCPPSTTTTTVHQAHHAPVAEPILAHHQNIGGHHFPSTAASMDKEYKHQPVTTTKTTGHSHNVV